MDNEQILLERIEQLTEQLTSRKRLWRNLPRFAKAYIFSLLIPATLGTTFLAAGASRAEVAYGYGLPLALITAFAVCVYAWEIEAQ